MVVPADAAFTGGTLTLRIVATDEVLGRIDVGLRRTAIHVTRRFPAGSTLLRADPD